MAARRMTRTNVYWPAIVDTRLDELVTAARNAGEHASRAELLAALVSQASADGEGLGVIVRDYRRKLLTATEPPALTRRPGPRAAAPPVD